MKRALPRPLKTIGCTVAGVDPKHLWSSLQVQALESSTIYICICIYIYMYIHEHVRNHVGR